MPVEEVCAAFELGRPRARPVAASGGLLHRLWRLDTDRASYAVKMLQPPAGLYEEPWLAAYERSFELERAAVEAGLPTPVPVPARDGSWLARIQGSSVRVHQWVEGERLPDRDPGPALAAQAGRLLARVHLLRVVRETAPEAVLPGWPIQSWLEREAEVPELRGMSEVQQQINEALAEARELVRAPVLSHKDVNAKNLIRTPDGGLSLIDWELNGPVEPALEAAAAAIDWAGAFWWEPDADVVSGFLSGYLEGGGSFPPHPDRRLLALWLESAAGFAATCHRRALHARTLTERRQARRNASFMVSQLRRGLEARERWAQLLQV